MRAPTVIDLFCGAGGFSLGAHRAGFKVLLSVDVDEKLTSSYKSNFPQAQLLIADISQLQTRTLMKKAGARTPEIDGIIGGPPCQGFSTIGRRNTADPRNALLHHFFRLVAGVRPCFFLMENVPGLISDAMKGIIHREIAFLKGYEIIGPLALDAHDFGAPTRRRRVVVFGYDPRRVERISEADIRSLSQPKQLTVEDAILDLPEPSARSSVKYRKVRNLSEYATWARSAPPEGLGSKASRARLSLGVVSGLQPTRHTPDVVERFGTVPQGTTEQISRCVRLNWSAPAPTLRAGTGPDKGSFQSVRPIHPAAPRVITVREAARLQGFPDWFEFHETKWHSFRMIGNSVSPIMAEALLKFVSSKLRGS